LLRDRQWQHFVTTLIGGISNCRRKHYNRPTIALNNSGKTTMSAGTANDIHITDFANPVLSTVERQARDSAPEVKLSSDAVLGAACATTGLGDFGADDFRERLEVWLQSFNEDTGLSRLGRAMAFDTMVRFASNRLRIEDLIRRHPEILTVELPRPLIVAGLPRSGTTHLVNLLATHPNLRSMQLWESNEPVPKPDEMNWESSDANPRYRRSNEVWHIMTNVLVHWAAMHEWAPGHVHEDVELHAFDFSSYIIDWMARVRRWQRYYFEHDQTPHYAYVRKVTQMMTWLHGPNRWVTKCPQNMENLPALFRVYPDAAVVITHRDPVAVLQSALTLMAYTDRIRRTEMDLPDLRDYWFDRIERLLRQCVKDRDTLPKGQVMDVMFHEYMADERGTFTRACELAGIPCTADAEQRLTQYLHDNPRGKKGRVVYDLKGLFDVDIAALRKRFQFYYDRFPVRQERVLGE
jgi:Sulfotransferase family